jgi:hypothetical protein
MFIALFIKLTTTKKTDRFVIWTFTLPPRNAVWNQPPHCTRSLFSSQHAALHYLTPHLYVTCVTLNECCGIWTVAEYRRLLQQKDHLRFNSEDVPQLDRTQTALSAHNVRQHLPNHQFKHSRCFRQFGTQVMWQFECLNRKPHKTENKGHNFKTNLRIILPLFPVGQRFSNFIQVGTTFISQNVLRTTLLLNVLSIC